MDNNIQGVHHTAIIVEDMERSVAFYRDLLGLEFLKDYTNSGPVAVETLGLEDPSQRIVLFSAGDDETLVELCQYLSPVGRPQSADIRENDIGIRHLCFQVEDIQAAYDKLGAAGVKFTSPPVVQASGVICAFFRDPDGNSLELLQVAG